MLPDIKSPPPIAFNPLKHHIQWVKELLDTFRREYPNSLLTELDKGNNLLCDYYYGDLDVVEIGWEIIKRLKEKDLFDRGRYTTWINSHVSKFRNLVIKDGSEWTLLTGDEDRSYIHIHPARYSKNTIRVRFLALKTAILLKAMSNKPIPEIQDVNLIRTHYLNVSPVKEDGNISHILRVCALFSRLPQANL